LTTSQKKGKCLPTYDDTITLKERVFLKLEKFPNISPKELCRLLAINYRKCKNTIKTYKYEWKKSKSKDREALKSLSFHNVRFFGYVPKSCDLKKESVRSLALESGWIQTKAKNHMMIWRDPKGLGRIEWFRSGRVNAWVRKPAILGKMKQLLCNAFFPTLVTDINLFSDWAGNFKLKGFHLVMKTGERLPYAKINMLKESNGIIAVIGDSSHRDGLELQVIYPDWVERQEQLFRLNIKAFEDFSKFMEELSTPKTLRKDASGMVV